MGVPFVAVATVQLPEPPVGSDDSRMPPTARTRQNESVEQDRYPPATVATVIVATSQIGLASLGSGEETMWPHRSVATQRLVEEHEIAVRAFSVWHDCVPHFS